MRQDGREYRQIGDAVRFVKGQRSARDTRSGREVGGHRGAATSSGRRNGRIARNHPAHTGPVLARHCADLSRRLARAGHAPAAPALPRHAPRLAGGCCRLRTQRGRPDPGRARPYGDKRGGRAALLPRGSGSSAKAGACHARGPARHTGLQKLKQVRTSPTLLSRAGLLPGRRRRVGAGLGLQAGAEGLAGLLGAPTPTPLSGPGGAGGPGRCFLRALGGETGCPRATAGRGSREGPALQETPPRAASPSHARGSGRGH